MINIQILAGVIHQLNKSAHTKGASNTTLVERDSLHDENDLLNQFVRKIDQDSRKSSRATSKSARFTENNTLSKTLIDHFKKYNQQCIQKDNFLDLSKALVRAFKIHMQDTSTAKGGHIPVLWYKRNDEEFLLMGVVNPTGGFTIDPNGNIVSNTNIDEDALRFSVSIELSQFTTHYNVSSQENNNELSISNYVRWTTKKNNEISHYFQDFVPTDIEIDDNKTTKNVIKYISNYLNSIIPDGTPEKSKLLDIQKQNIYHLMLMKGKAGKTVNIEDDIIPLFGTFINSNPNIFPNTENVKDFSTYCDEQGYSNDYISIFHPNVNTVNKKINVDIEIQETIKIKGALSEIIETTELIIDNSDPDNLKYKFSVSITHGEFECIKNENPSIAIQQTISNNESKQNDSSPKQP